jgi:hypothetical protein
MKVNPAVTVKIMPKWKKLIAKLQMVKRSMLAKAITPARAKDQTAKTHVKARVLAQPMAVNKLAINLVKAKYS